MICIVPRRDLLLALTQARRVSNLVRLEAQGSSLMVQARSSDLCLTTQVTATVETPGSVVADCKDLHGICRAWPMHAFVRLETTEERIRVTAGEASPASAELCAGDVDRLAPVLDADSWGLVGHCAEGCLSEILRVAAVACRDATRAAICFVLLEARQETLESETTLRATTTDGTRLAYAQTLVSENTVQGSWLISPLAASLLDVLGAHAVSLSVAREKGQEEGREGPIPSTLLRATTSTATLTMRVSAGTDFPDSSQVVPPESTPKRASIDREALRAAASACAIFSAGTVNKTTVMEAFEGGLRLRTNREGEGEHMEDPVAADLHDWPESLRLGVNAKMLAELLTITRGDRVTLCFADTLSPIRWALDDAGGVALIMPVRLGDSE